MHSNGQDILASASGVLVRRCFRLLSAGHMRLTITLADITEEEFRTMELIEAERQRIAGQGAPPAPKPPAK